MQDEEQKILGFSGRKQSGKNTACNLVLGLELMKMGMVQGGIAVTEKGKLWVSDIAGEKEHTGEFDFYNPHPLAVAFREDHICPYVKLYSFADLLKKEVCIRILGLTFEQCFGTDEEKDTYTSLKWEDMPGIWAIPEGHDDWKEESNHLLTKHLPGYMTAREVLQYVGTNIFRKMYGNVWSDATIRQIKTEGSLYAIASDVRFPNEVRVIQDAGGKVIRFTRNPAGDSDVHESETALDRENYDWDNFDSVIDNETMNVNEQNLATRDLLCSWDWCEPIKNDNTDYVL